MEVQVGYMELQEGCMEVQEDYIGVPEDYMEVQHDYMEVQEGYMEVQEGYMEVYEGYMEVQEEYMKVQEGYMEVQYIINTSSKEAHATSIISMLRTKATAKFQPNILRTLSSCASMGLGLRPVYKRVRNVFKILSLFCHKLYVLFTLDFLSCFIYRALLEKENLQQG